MKTKNGLSLNSCFKSKQTMHKPFVLSLTTLVSLAFVTPQIAESACSGCTNAPTTTITYYTGSCGEKTASCDEVSTTTFCSGDYAMTTSETNCSWEDGSSFGHCNTVTSECCG